MTNDIEQWRREHGVPDYVPWPEQSREEVFGIGAYDRMEINMERAAYRGWADFDGDLSPWYEAGELYAMARRGANEMRRKAADRAAIIHTLDVRAGDLVARW